jgi:hypothetical protein
MKTVIAVIAILLSVNTLYGQNGSSPTYETKGLFFNASLLGAAWTTDDMNIDAESGGGLGLKLGYNFSSHIGLYTSLDAALMNPDEDEYVLAHLDIGLQGIFRPETARFRPFLRVSVSGMTARDDETEINGAGIGFGGGALFFLTRNMALDINYMHGLIDLSEVKVGSQSVDIDETATTGRLLFGLGWYF